MQAAIKVSVSVLQYDITTHYKVKNEGEYPWLHLWAPLLSAVGDQESITPHDSLVASESCICFVQYIMQCLFTGPRFLLLLSF